jgi:capsular polysaccharide biosynthesis protein
MSRRWAPLILVAALALAVVGTTYLYANSQPNVYSSRAVVSFSPRDAGRVGADNLQLASSRYVAYLSSGSTQRQVATDIGEEQTQVAKATQVRIQPATLNLEIVVTMRDAARAARISNALAAAALREARVDPLVTVELIVPAVVPRAPSGPKRSLIMIGGLGVALILSVVGVAALGYFRNSPTLGGDVPLRMPPVRRRRDPAQV